MAYALAVLAFACDFAFGRHAIGPLKAAQEPAADLVAVGSAPRAADPAPSGGPPDPGSDGGSPGPGTSAPAAPAAGPGAGRDAGGMGRWVQVAIALTVLGLAAHIVGVVSRGLAVHRVP